MFAILDLSAKKNTQISDPIVIVIVTLKIMVVAKKIANQISASAIVLVIVMQS